LNIAQQQKGNAKEETFRVDQSGGSHPTTQLKRNSGWEENVSFLSVFLGLRYSLLSLLTDIQYCNSPHIP
jgi:hypothetical protein